MDQIHEVTVQRGCGEISGLICEEDSEGLAVLDKDNSMEMEMEVVG
jgi:hypothetical protein